jgi:AraC-like DNA-binding protein
MSKVMNEDSLDSFRPPCRVHFFQVSRNLKGRTPLHSHSYWQLELIVQGKALLECREKARREVSERDAVVIPPGHLHRFAYPSQGLSIISIKFRYEAGVVSGGVKILKRSPFTSPFFWSIESFLPQDRVLASAEKDYLAHLLSPVIYTYFHYEELQRLHLDQMLSERVMRLVRANIRKRLTLDFFARALNYSKVHLNAQFKEERGETIMEYVRRVKVEVTRGCVACSQLSVKEIAEEYGFADAYTFSKFFKRYAGISPREYRNRYG